MTATQPPLPITGGTLLALPDGHTVVAADPERDHIYVVDYVAGTIQADLALQAGDEPGRVAADDQGRVHVALRRGGAVVTLAPSADTWTIAARRAVCAAPRGLAYAADTQLLHVACAEGDLVSLPAAPDGAVAGRITLDRDLRDVVVKGSRLFVSRFRSAEVLVVDGGAVVARLLPATGMSFHVVQMISSDGRSGSGGAAQVPMVPAVAWRMVADPNGDVLLLHQRAFDGVIDLGQTGGYGGGSCGGIVESTVSALGPATATLASATLGNLALVVDLAVSSDGSSVALTAPGNDRQQVNGLPQVVVMKRTDAVAGAVAGPATGPVNCAFATTPPPSLPPGADGGADQAPPFVVPSGEVVAVAFDSHNALLVQTREPATIQVPTARGLTIRLASDIRLDSGHGIFHTNSGAGLACASCHPEGGDDGRVWRFRLKDGTAVPRRTQNLRGGILATAPFHWDGLLPDVGHLMTEVFVGRMGGPNLGTDYVTTLSRWLDTIPAMPALPIQDAAAVERGRGLFAARCTACHSGSLLTDNKNRDVGTGQALQVPSLRGVSWRAPYMHDGCAATLRDRFVPSCGGGDAHGGTSQLVEADLSDLIAFLESL